LPFLMLVDQRMFSLVDFGERALLVPAVGLTLYFVYVQCWIAQRIRTSSGTDAPHMAAVIVLSILWGLSLPYLQSHANRSSYAPRPA